ncbi:hypothetical protein PC129_g22551 [Phytophthora cactorum]|uniref:Uncharacterized protein n=1 Tax=Phytophthora cactorum TaxID=29920 RepID=A0A8T1H2K1_9STRA|nr:hypothetical protein PC129_g22551 [Phytophthora cactorum]
MNTPRIAQAPTSTFIHIVRAVQPACSIAPCSCRPRGASALSATRLPSFSHRLPVLLAHVLLAADAERTVIVRNSCGPVTSE